MKHLVAILCLFCVSGIFAQDYFQQEVHYKIDVTLDDKNHTLSGFEEFEYVNKSNAALDRIYVHLWPSGYKHKRTALGNQLIDQNNTTLEFAEAKDQGYIDSLAFKIDGNDARWELDPENPDIAVIHLNSVLQVGKSVKVSTPFFVKIPNGNISRLGHVDESYQITQWYVKPAVYDKNGWNDMPYLTQGEFYSEFGTYDVSITVPKNYVVGATGDLQTQSEKDFLDTLAAQTQRKFDKGAFASKTIKTVTSASNAFPDSDDETKTIRFTQENVHDFAWFADKRYLVLKGEAKLESGKAITTWAMFTPKNALKWKKSIEFINDGLFYYSKWNGDYPYDVCTAVDGTISAGGGMEYPNITVIGNTSSERELEIVIVHEVGHNWFYGLLGSNEREHAWMDEGLNTLNEIRYMETKYPKNTNMSDMFGTIAERVHMGGLSHRDMSDFTYSLMAGYGIDQPIELPSPDYSAVNYGAIVYAKTGLVFTYLRDYLGDDEFDRIMHIYYDEWHYKHPQPEDLKAVFDRECKKDLTWFWEDIIPTTGIIDYKLKKVKKGDSGTDVTVKSVGHIDGPIRVDGIKNGEVVETVWAEGYDCKTTVNLKGTDFDRVVIDYDKRVPEPDRTNNCWKNGGFKKVEKPKWEFLAGDNERDQREVWYTPIVGGNVYDKFMVGFLIHNQTLPKNKFEYTLAPMFSVGRLNLSGFADLNYTWVPKKNFRSITLGGIGKTFGKQTGTMPDSTEEVGTYYVGTAYLRMAIGKPAAKKYFTQELELRLPHVLETGQDYFHTLVGASADYNFKYNRRRLKVDFGLGVDWIAGDTRIDTLAVFKNRVLNSDAELTFEFTYWKEKNKTIELRFFYGQNLYYSGPDDARYGFSLTGQSGSMDYAYNSYMFGRDRVDGLWGNQRIENQGGFKSTSSYGVSNRSIFGANFVFNLPYLPICLYADYGMFQDNVTGTYESIYDVGAGVRFGKIFGVYFPFYEASSMQPAGTSYGKRIRFTLTMEGLRPSKLIQSNL